MKAEKSEDLQKQLDGQLKRRAYLEADMSAKENVTYQYILLIARELKQIQKLIATLEMGILVAKLREQIYDLELNAFQDMGR